MPLGAEGEGAARAGLSQVALGLVGSEILKIAADVRALQAQGRKVCNLTVGDFAPSEFRIPRSLERGIASLLERGETNYPPSDGVLSAREAVADYYARELGLRYPVSSVVIAGGARPVIYATYRAVVDPGERVLYPVPSWNNNHYVFMSRAVPVEVMARPEDDFLPTSDLLRHHLDGVRLLSLNSPLNPTGTALSREALTEISVMVVEENRRRAARGDRPLYVMYDQVYWTLTFGDTRHHTPVELVPEMAAYTVFVDGISKAFAATGLRVGWTVAPPYVAARMRDLLGHVGAWAPRAEQIAAGELLADPEGIAAYHAGMRSEVQARLDALYEGFRAMAEAGLPVRAIPPQGAIYLSARFDLMGRRLPGGALFSTNEQVRQYLLEKAGVAVVPFQAFGRGLDDGWFRLSVGAVSVAGIAEALPRIRAALRDVI
ncbi:aminotransferase class I/II-fold pyridoxal phosphate-dependent enzyme [Myxococcota bacterium]|nr:aminotransferase class I/II-fold pyridoxal phosphate-dependent enzyme [Myxococcota bacterium]